MSDGIVQQVADHSTDGFGLGCDDDAARRAERHIDATLESDGTQDLDRLIGEIGQVGRRGIEVEIARFDSRQQEEIIDERIQSHDVTLQRAIEAIGVLCNTVTKGFDSRLHRGEWSTKVMPHGGEELTPASVLLLSFLSCFLEALRHGVEVCGELTDLVPAVDARASCEIPFGNLMRRPSHLVEVAGEGVARRHGKAERRNQPEAEHDEKQRKIVIAEEHPACSDDQPENRNDHGHERDREQGRHQASAPPREQRQKRCGEPRDDRHHDENERQFHAFCP